MVCELVEQHHLDWTVCGWLCRRLCSNFIFNKGKEIGDGEVILEDIKFVVEGGTTMFVLMMMMHSFTSIPIYRPW